MCVRERMCVCVCVHAFVMCVCGMCVCVFEGGAVNTRVNVCVV